MAPRPELAALHLCSGYGGFELITRLAGIPARTVAHIERDSHAAAILMARMGEATLDPAPIWDDLTTFKGAAWRGRVDLVTAGFPCQPFSAAGEGRGVDDERWIWPDIARIIADVGPRHVFVENVTGLIRHGLPHILADLADLGFNAEWGCLAASAVGAPHERRRVWLWATLGNADGEGRSEVAGGASGDEGQDGWGANRADFTDGPVEDVAYSGDGGRVRRGTHSAGGRSAEGTVTAPQGRVQTLEHAEGPRLPTVGASGGQAQQSGPDASSDYAWPPGRDDADGWAAYGGPEPVVCRSADGAAGKLVRPRGHGDRLHALGNGLVPQAGAHALRQLIAHRARLSHESPEDSSSDRLTPTVTMCV